ncbi:outer membrane protein OmpA [Roseivivax marinus]|uniref:Outer membrane protein OmpA n=1 Tax=Roseivivax marinus TaxID=1379903 RepID=W4HDB6_9RHOB|nr:OmpA family protein [Roseivivax marinus]ETW10734.1 outer membrane protein OmpA [Roseivivax marinus]UMA64186.1 OmpA family protein [Roseivivax marinus]
MTHLTRALAALAVTGAAAAAAVPAQAQDTQTCGIYVFFNSGQSSVGASARDVLIEFARDYPGAQMTVTGYSDAAGSAAANQALSLQRAQSVAAALAGTEILAVNGVGEAVRPGTTGPNDPSNRRVEALRADCDEVPGVVTDNAGLAAGAGVAALAIGAAVAGDDDDSDSGTSTGGTGD